jgi:hypothetical protein
MTPGTLKRVTAGPNFRLALLQATETCTTGGPGCRGGARVRGYSGLLVVSRAAVSAARAPARMPVMA